MINRWHGTTASVWKWSLDGFSGSPPNKNPGYAGAKNSLYPSRPSPSYIRPYHAQSWKRHLFLLERRSSPVVGRSFCTPAARVQFPGWEARIIRCKNMALYIRDCESLCHSDETLKAVGPFYMVSMPGEVKDPTQGVNV